MLAATFLKNPICTFSDRRLDDLLMSILTALDSDYPIVKTLSISSVHSNTPLRMHLCDYSVKSRWSC